MYQITIFTSDKINSTSTAHNDASGCCCCSVVCYGCMHFWIALLRYCRKMTRTHTYECEKNSMRKRTNGRANERKKENRTLMLAVFCDCFNFQRMLMFFFISSLCVVYIPVQQNIPAAAAALINLLRYNIIWMCVCACVLGTCLISRFLFILIWFLFMLKFIRCHAVDFTFMSEFRSSHSDGFYKYTFRVACVSAVLYSTF